MKEKLPIRDETSEFLLCSSEGGFGTVEVLLDEQIVSRRLKNILEISDLERMVTVQIERHHQARALHNQITRFCIV